MKMKNTKIIRNSVITIISIGVFIWSFKSYNKASDKRYSKSREAYIQNCMQEMDGLNFSDIQKRNACSCRHEYLFSKYQRDIYKKGFVIPTRADSLFVINCLLNESQLQGVSSDSLLILLDSKNED